MPQATLRLTLDELTRILQQSGVLGTGIVVIEVGTYRNGDVFMEMEGDLPTGTYGDPPHPATMMGKCEMNGDKVSHICWYATKEDDDDHTA